MNEAALTELVKKIQTTQAEFQTVEVKRSKTKATTRLYDTLSSFSNQDDGGIIVFGLYENEGFAVYGPDGWSGTLTALQPQHGYVYVSTAQEAKTLKFYTEMP